MAGGTVSHQVYAQKADEYPVVAFNLFCSSHAKSISECSLEKDLANTCSHYYSIQCQKGKLCQHLSTTTYISKIVLQRVLKLHNHALMGILGFSKVPQNWKEHFKFV